jgi:hypothetical protein
MWQNIIQCLRRETEERQEKPANVAGFRPGFKPGALDCGNVEMVCANRDHLYELRMKVTSRYKFNTILKQQQKINLQNSNRRPTDAGVA